MPPRKPMRILSAIGPGDGVAAFRDWKNNVRTLSETAITFSSQEFELFKKCGIPFWAIASHPRRESVVDGSSRIENRPRVTAKPVSGFRFHVVQLLYGFSLVGSAIRFRATHAIVDSGTTHWFALSLLRLFGIEVIPNFFNAYWPDGKQPSGVMRRAMLWLDSLFFRHCVRSVVGMSPDGRRQIGEISRGNTAFFEYRAQFTLSDFGQLQRPVPSTQMRIMFAGRIEPEKGVFDILKICEILSARHPNRYVFDICGAGSASSELAAEIAARGLEGSIVLHGMLVRPELLKVYGQSHLVIVPTRSNSSEGLPMVCAEAVIAGRPVITSRVSNSFEALRGAVIEAHADDPLDYAAKIESLSNDPEAYARLVRNTGPVSVQFMNPALGLAAALEQCLVQGQWRDASEARR